MSDPEHTLRQSLARLIDGMAVDALLFTTFTFDPEFFESNVLPVVTGVDHVATIRELQVISEEALQLGVAVFHDGRARGRRTKRATYPTIPVFLDVGVFHPKLIIASGSAGGRVETRVMVSSANLTFAGWGRQRESVVVCSADAFEVAAPLSMLLRWLDANTPESDEASELLERVVDRLDAVAKVDRDGPRLVVSLPDEGEPLARELASGAGPVWIAAPYFSPGLTGWLQRVLGERPVTLIPAVHADEVDLEATELHVLTDSPTISFARLGGDDGARFDHLKLIHAAGRLVIGSHNATMAALGADVDVRGTNVEASLSVACETFPFPTRPLDPIPRGKPASQKTEEQERLLSSLPVSVSVHLHWAASEYRVEVGATRLELTLALPGVDRRLPFETANHRFTDADDVAQALQNRRVFRVWEGDELVHEGFVNEVGWRHARPVGRFASLHDCFDAWRSRTVATSATAGRNVTLLGAQNDHDIEAMLQLDTSEVATSDLLETYFSFFRAVRGLRESLEAASMSDARHADAIAMQYLERAPGSLREAYRHVLVEQAKAGDADLVFWFVVVHELNKLAQQAVAWCAKWPHVRETAAVLAADYAAMVVQARATDWYATTAGSDGERLTFMLSALEYGEVDDAI